MKTTTKRKYLFMAICILQSMVIQSQVVYDSLHVTAGNLSTLLGSKKNLITNLTLSGTISGMDAYTVSTMDKLDVLDISDAVIVGGYWSDGAGGYATVQPNTIPNIMVTNVATVITPKSVPSINNFQYCYKLKHVKISEGAKTIEDRAFKACTGLISVELPQSLTALAGPAFYYCTGLTSINLPDSLISIGDGAFKGCSGLTSIIVPDNVSYLGRYAFEGCGAITSVHIGSGIKTINEFAFVYCSSLTSIIIPNSITTISNDAFYYCHNLKTLDLPSSIITIGDSAFYNSGLTSIYLPDNVKLGNEVFKYCSALKEITVSENSVNYSSIDGVLFDKSNKLLIAYPNAKSTEYTVPKGVTSIGRQSFYNSDIRVVTFPESLNSIGFKAFGSCDSLKSIVLPDSVTTVGTSVFTGCTNLKSAKLGAGLQNISSGMFYNCQNLTAINIPEAVGSIGSSAFYNCKLISSISLSNNVSAIAPDAFSLCSGLTEIHCKRYTPPVATNPTFNKVNVTSCILYVPIGRSTTYRNTAPWSLFTNIIEEDGTAVPQTSSTGLRVYPVQGAIVVSGAVAGNTVYVYTTTGVLLQRTNLTFQNLHIQLPGNNIYVVRVADKTFKVVL